MSSSRFGQLIITQNEEVEVTSTLCALQLIWRLAEFD